MQSVNKYALVQSPTCFGRLCNLYQGAVTRILVRVNVKFILEQSTKAQKGLYSLFNLGAPRWGWVVSTTPRPIYPQERDPVTIVQEDGWTPGPVWTGAENLVPQRGFDPRTVQARSESLHRLNYRGPQ